MTDLRSKVSLSIACTDLESSGFLSNSDAFCVVYQQVPPQHNENEGVWRIVGTTSTKNNDSNPCWNDEISLQYHFEKIQKLKFDIYDRENESNNLKEQTQLGTFETTLATILATKSSIVTAAFITPSGHEHLKSRISVKATQKTEKKDLFEFRFSASNVARKNFMGIGRSDPYYTISCLSPERRFVQIFRSEYISRNLNPSWEKRRLFMSKLCNGDPRREIRIDVSDYSRVGKDNFIGFVVTSVAELMEKKSLTLVAKNDKASGTLHIDSAQIVKGNTFLEYIQGGCELKLMIAIDFTRSNGDPSNWSSLHAIQDDAEFGPGQFNVTKLNEYQKAILSVTQVLEIYDSDRMIPVYGFGGQLPPGSKFDPHCFPLSLDAAKTEVAGTKGVMEVYKSSLKKVELNGPTFFEKIISTARKEATKKGARQSYTTLLILTDGIVNDMHKTIELIVKSSSEPLSIIIVGVGNADFGDMEVLDGDGDAPLSYGKTKIERDIVQFVQFSKFKEKSFTALAEETLKEVPTQMEEYFNLKGIVPGTASSV